MPAWNHYDVVVVIGYVLVFTLPLTLLFPEFSLWDVVPKVRVKRYQLINQELTWTQINVVMSILLFMFLCLYLEIRKRKLDDMVEKVVTVCQETEAMMALEKERTSAAARVCLKLVDSSIDHYENLVLFRQDLRNKAIANT